MARNTAATCTRVDVDGGCARRGRGQIFFKKNNSKDGWWPFGYDSKLVSIIAFCLFLCFSSSPAVSLSPVSGDGTRAKESAGGPAVKVR